MLAADGARLVLSGNGQGDSPRSGWLIHLADRDVPLELAHGGNSLGVPPFDHKPRWIPATPLNSPPDWWAVRLRHVFLLSRDAVEQAINTNSGNAKKATEWRWVKDGFYRFGTKYPLKGQPLKLLKVFVRAGELGDGYVLTHQQINEACSEETERAGQYVAELNKALCALWRLEIKPITAIPKAESLPIDPAPGHGFHFVKLP